MQCKRLGLFADSDYAQPEALLQQSVLNMSDRRPTKMAKTVGVVSKAARPTHSAEDCKSFGKRVQKSNAAPNISASVTITIEKKMRPYSSAI